MSTLLIEAPIWHRSTTSLISTVEKHGEILPHWQQGEVMQFVTFRLGDALPKEKVQLWLTHHPKPWDSDTEAAYHKEFTWRLERWLDRGSGTCLLREPAARDILAEVLMKFHGDRYEHHAWGHHAESRARAFRAACAA